MKIILKAFLLLVALTVVMPVLLTVFNNINQELVTSEVDYAEFIREVRTGQVTSVNIAGVTVNGVRSDNTRFNTTIPMIGDDQLMDDLFNNGVEIRASEPERQSLWTQLLVASFPILIIVTLIMIIRKVFFFKLQMRDEDVNQKGIITDEAIIENSTTTKELINDKLVFYGQAYEEIVSGDVEKSLWAICFANSKDEESTKRLYIKKRASYLNEIFLRDKDGDQIEALIEEEKSISQEGNEREIFIKIAENEACKIEAEERQRKKKNQEILKILRPFSEIFFSILFIFFISSFVIITITDSIILRWVYLSITILSVYQFIKISNIKLWKFLAAVFLVYQSYASDIFDIREKTVVFFNNGGIDNAVTEFIRSPEQAITSYNLTQFEALSCDNVSRHEGENLINVFGRRTEIIRIYDGEQVSRTSTELVCNATSFLSSGGGETDLQVKYSLINGEVFLEIKHL